MATARVRVVAKDTGNMDKERAFRGLLNAFKNQVNKSGVLSEYKKREFFESKGEKRRRKRKEAIREHQKNKKQIGG